MLISLKPHKDTPPSAISAIRVEIDRPAPEMLELKFRLQGEMDLVSLPGPAPSRRRDNLWQRTCFEAFVRPEGANDYFELNLSPSKEWAAYRFDGYRSGMAPALDCPPVIDTVLGQSDFELHASVEGLPASGIWQLAIAAVAEEKNGRKSYWALSHPPGKPDFHHRDCFALQLPSAAPR